jgi:hypothetical protein
MLLTTLTNGKQLSPILSSFCFVTAIVTSIVGSPSCCGLIVLRIVSFVCTPSCRWIVDASSDERSKEACFGGGS